MEDFSGRNLRFFVGFSFNFSIVYEIPTKKIIKKLTLSAHFKFIKEEAAI